MRQALMFTIILALCPFVGPGTGEAAGPWQAQIVDAETGQPLKDVIVLAVWYKMTRGPAGPSGRFYDAEEVVTSPDGRFTIVSRWTFTLDPFTYIKDPEFTIFKPGYGRWRVQDWAKKPKAWEELTAGEVLEKDEIVIELPPLKTRAERLRFLVRLSWSAPADRARLLLEAIKRERAYLGLRN